MGYAPKDSLPGVKSMDATLEALLAAQDDDANPPPLLILRLLRLLRVSIEDLRRVPVGHAVARWAKQDEQPLVAREAQVLKREWKALMVRPTHDPPVPPTREEPRMALEAGREESRVALEMALGHVNDPAAIATVSCSLEEAAHLAAGGSSSGGQYGRLLSQTAGVLAASPLLQALACSGALGDSAATLRALEREPDALRLLEGALRTHGSPAGQRAARADALADLSLRRKQREAVAAAARASDAEVVAGAAARATQRLGGESFVGALYAHLQPLDWCRFAAVSHEWRQCAADGSLWALAFRERWPCAGALPPSASVPCTLYPPSASEARDAYRSAHVRGSSTAVAKLHRGARKGERGLCQRMLQWGVEVRVRGEGEG